jgi:hypothetical protein
MVRLLILSAVLTVGLMTIANAGFAPNAIGDPSDSFTRIAEGCGPGWWGGPGGRSSDGERTCLSERIPPWPGRWAVLAELRSSSYWIERPQPALSCWGFKLDDFSGRVTCHKSESIRETRLLAMQHLTEAQRILSQFGQAPILARVETALAELEQ